MAGPINPFVSPIIFDFDLPKAKPAPKEGQIWQSNINKDVKIKIVEDDLTLPYNLRVTCIECDHDEIKHHGWYLGLTTVYQTTILHRAWKLYRDDNKAGVDCTKCKRHYPYQDHVSNFVCWACKNGY